MFNTQGINTNTVAITDYKIVASKVARVVISYTGKQTAAQISAAIGSQLKNLATPVEASFRLIRDNVAVGFVRANREVRQVEDKELRASYRVMSSTSNIMMNNEDKTLWELKSSPAGKYLARHGEEDLSSLVQASVTTRTDVPTLAQLTLSAAAPKEFVAFATESGDMDYGFCTAASSDGNKLKVVSHTTGRETTIPSAVVAGVYNIKIKRSTHEKLVQAGVNANDKATSVAYYTQLYGYDSAYLGEVIKNIEDSAAM